MALGILTLITALSISAVAIYYSIAGLVAIFAAAALPIMIMGGVLEVGKLVTAVWLHKYWSQAKWWLKTYLATAVVVLMFITSMGIFGFLSKAHIEQTSAGTESVAQVERIESEIQRNEDIIERAEAQIKKLETSGTGTDANIQAQIDKEQERIDSAYKRIQPAIDEQQKIIDSQSELWRSELEKIDNEIATLQGYIDNGETKKAQQMIGASADGIFGKKTADKIGDWQAQKQKERLELIQKIEESTNNPQARAAADEIKRLRKGAEDQIAQSNALIDRLRKQLGNEDKAASIDAEVDAQNLRIKNANAEIDTLIEQKYAIEGEYRKLEAEVGPIKYIAEFIYGDTADNNMLEEAVRWVIITIIFVFDPLAVLMLIASQYTFEFARRRKDDDGDRLRQEYEQLRAQKIADNPGFNNIPPLEEKEEKVDDTEPTTTTDDDSRDMVSEDDTTVADAVDNELESDKVQDDESQEERAVDGLVTADTTGAGDNGGDSTDGMAMAGNNDHLIEKKDLESSEELKSDLDQWNAWVEAANKEAASESIESRAKEITEQEHDPKWTEAKRKWKQENPQQNIKDWKHAYITGRIEILPWASYVNDEDVLEQEQDKLIEGYRQNEEQSESSLWKNIKDNDNK
jgi:hypothetical protein